MAYQLTCIINGENIELEKMRETTRLSELLTAIQRKSGIPPNRQQLMAEHGNIETQDKNKTLNQLHLPTNCHLLIIDSDPDGDLEILSNEPNNENNENNNNELNKDSNDNDIKMKNNEIKEEKENKSDEIDEEYEFPIFKFEDNENKIEGELIPEDEINELLLILFGTNSKRMDVDRWYSQGLGFIKDNDKDNDIRFGLLQIHGGPCGIMSPIQAYMLKEMCFDASMNVILDDDSEIPLLPTNEQREEALIRALVSIISKAAIDETYITWIISGERESKKYYRVIVKTNDELKTIIKYTLSKNGNGLLNSRIGIISFVLSILLSRSIPIILNEVDDKTQPLILPEHGHCSQELVNLMITGKCVTNIHDGDKVLGDGNDAFILKGIEPNQEIGFLTTLECMRLAKVGNNYKCPQYPIWVIGSSSHYTTLFSININVSKITEHDKKIQLLRQEFNKFDVEEQGIIKMDNLQQLLNNLKSNFTSYQIKPYFNTGQVILWSDFERVWKMLENQQNYGWNCFKCTFWNKMDANMCDVCVSNKGDAPIIEKQKSINNNNNQNNDETNASDKPPKHFTLYLYNGLKATKKDKPQITKLSVWADAELHQFHSESEELQSLVRTKFPYAIVEYASSYAPKIM